MNDFLFGKLKSKGWVAADADATKLNVAEMVGAKMADGSLSLAEYGQWMDEYKAQAAQKSTDAENRVKSIVESANAPMLQRFDQLIGLLAGSKAAPAAAKTDDSAAALAALDAAATVAAKRFADATQAKDDAPSDAKADAVADGFRKSAADSAAPRVKKASESWSHTKTALVHPNDRETHGIRRGDPVKMFVGEQGSPVGMDAPTQLDNAKAAAWFRFKARNLYANHGVVDSLTDHEMQLVKEILHEDYFVGMPAIGEKANDPNSRVVRRKLTDMEIKAVLDETGTSGGAEAVPEFFDSAIITTPLLYGELFPYVNVIPMSRGSSVDGFSHGTPTFVSTASGTGVSEFSTSGFVAAFDTTIFPATCAISWGLDFESDTIPEFGASVLNQIGMEAMRWLDEQIAVGDGTTEPQGIFTATGTSVASANGTSGALTYNDALNLSFGIGKAARNALGGRCRYVMKDADYKQFMQIATGVTGDTRPIFGMQTKSYQLGEYPVSVQDNVSAGNIAFCNLGGYRLYRRQTLQFTSTAEGSTLLLSNRRLTVARMRWGGKLTLPTTYCAQMTDGSLS